MKNNRKPKKEAKKKQKIIKKLNFWKNKQNFTFFKRNVKHQHDTIQWKFNMELMIAQQWDGVKLENMFVFWIVEGR